MSANSYPNLENMCRLCLQEDVPRNWPIFSNAEETSSSLLAMRINSVCALELHGTVKGMPKNICSECRYQLEKSYCFRKRAQFADAKLKKHLRLLSLGKKSKLFAANEEDDEFDEELEFEDSLQLIRLHEGEKIRQMNEENEVKFQKLREELGRTMRDECLLQAKSELKVEVFNEVRAELKNDCMKEAKEELREEITNTIRKEQMSRILGDLEFFLNEKRIHNSTIPESNFNGSISDITISPKRVRSNRSISPESSTSPKRRFSQERNNLDEEQNTIMTLPIDSFEPKENVDNFFSVEDSQNHNDGNAEQCLSPIKIDDDDMSCDNNSHNDADENSPFEANNIANFELANPDNNLMSKTIANFQATSYKIGENGEIHLFHETKIPATPITTTENEVDDNNQVIYNLGSNEWKLIPNINEASSKDLKEIKINKLCKNLETSVGNCEQIVVDFLKPFNKSETIKSFQCHECPMGFSSHKSLIRHKKVHEKFKATGIDHQCSICKIFVSTRWALNRHMLTHSNAKPHTCDQCGKSFSQREMLKRHLETHLSEKRHKCTECSASFAQRINLNLHIRHRHSNEIITPQHKCHLCEKAFLHASGLSRHLLAHTGFSFQCCECLRVFNDRSSIKRHLNAVHCKFGDNARNKIIEVSREI